MNICKKIGPTGTPSGGSDNHPVVFAFRDMVIRAFIVIMALSPVAAHGAPADISLVRDGKASFWLEVPPLQEEKCAVAIADFRRCFATVTGADIGDKPVAGGIPLKLETAEPPADLSEFEKHRMAGDYETIVKPDAVVLRAASSLGLVNGLYGLLDGWGCRWVFPGPLGEVLPQHPALTLPLGSHKTHIASDPRILAGGPKYFEGEIGDWVRRNRFGKESTVTAHHNWAEGIVPASVYNDPAKPATYHPEYFALIGGKRVEGTNPVKLQICTTNPDVIKMAIEKAKEYFRNNPLADTFPCSPEDNMNFCQCPQCEALDSGEKTFGGYPLMTDRVMAFVNQVARGICDEFPDKLVAVYAYDNYTSPPAHILPEKNVMVEITRMQFDLLHLAGRTPHDSASQYDDLIKAWKKLTPYIYTYQYNPIYWEGGLFCPNYLDYAKSIINERNLGVLGFRSDPGELPFRNKVTFLNDYLGIRAAVIEDLDPDKELASVCGAFYGPASGPMLKYFQTMAGVVNYPGPLEGGIRNFHRMFTPEMTDLGSKYLAQARSVAGQSPFKDRVRLAFLSHEYLVSYLHGIWAAQKGDYEGSMQAFKAMQRDIDALGAANAFDNAPARSLFMSEAEEMTMAEYFPDRTGYVRSWRLLGPLDNRDRSGEYRMEKFEPVVDWDTSVPGPDGKLVKWRSYQSPGGFLNFDKAFPGNETNWAPYTAYAGTSLTTTAPRHVLLQFNSFNSFRAYLNGKQIFYRPGENLDLPDKCAVAVDLNKGKNDLIFRCTETTSSKGFPCGFYLRVSDPKEPGRMPVDGISME